MKVCIVTWHNSQNYGTCLQAFSLFYYLQKAGFDVTLLNTKIYIDYKDVKYIPVIISRIQEHLGIYLREGKEVREKKKIKKKYLAEFKKREELFSDFRKNNMKITKPLSDEELSELSEYMDAFVTGSDQIWNPYFLKTRYLLDFVDDNTRKLSYSSSFGVTDLPNKKTEALYYKYLSRFQAVSVRERSGVNICRKIGLSSARLVLDPTLLLTEEEWEEILVCNRKDKLNTDDYLLCYFVGNNQKYWEYVTEVAKKTSCKIKVIPFSNIAYNTPFETCIETGPLEFISLIQNAKYVYTDSFHCACFCITFHRQFTVLERFLNEDTKSQNSRLKDLFVLLNMKSRFADFNNLIIPEKSEEIDYEKVDSKLKELRQSSIQYLTENLQK